MFQRKIVSATILIVILFVVSRVGLAPPLPYRWAKAHPTEISGSAQTSAMASTEISRTPSVEPTLEDNFNDFLHYTKIGRLDLAKGYAQAILASNPDPVKLTDLSKENPTGYEILLRVVDSAPDAELVMLSKQIIGIIEHGRFTRRAEPKSIVEEIRRLGSTERGWTMAVKRLQNAGEYAIPYMLDAMADPSRKEELPKIVLALPHIGKDAIRPLAAALQTEDVAIKAELIKALGQIGYPQSLGYLKYIVENDESTQLRTLAINSIRQIDPKALEIPAAYLFYRLAEQYYYHTESLAPAEEADFGNIWFWDLSDNSQDYAGQSTGHLTAKLLSEQVDRSYFYELMAMRACEWSLRADPGFGRAIGLWLAAFFKAESTGIEMPDYFGIGHADALVYATTAGPEYLHQALARAVRDNNAYVAFGAVESLAVTAGEKSLLYRVGTAQPLIKALSFDNTAVRYSAAIAIAEAGPTEKFPESRYVVRNLAEAIVSGPATDDTDIWDEKLANTYALRSAKAMLKVAQTRNPVINLSLAQAVLINAINDNRPEIQILVSQILAHLGSPDAQRAIAVMALNSQNSPDVRLAAFDSLVTSAKLHANMLAEEIVDGIYALISSAETDPDLRSAAAAAYGALNLPSRKVKDLILDQAKN